MYRRILPVLTVLGFLLHLVATILRGIGAERVPFANMYEFALTATLAIVLIGGARGDCDGPCGRWPERDR